MNYNLRKPKVLVVFTLTLVLVAIAVGQQNKNRRGDGSSVPPEAAKNATASKKEAQLNAQEADSPPDSNKAEARRARQERHQRKP
jgi:hypothetical protein